jgi:hypothetical protein
MQLLQYITLGVMKNFLANKHNRGYLIPIHLFGYSLTVGSLVQRK